MPYWRAVALTGGQGDGAGAAPAGELRFASEPERVFDLDDQGGGGDRADPGLVTQGGAVGVEQLVDPAFERADLAAGSPVLVDERQEPGDPVGAGLGRHDGGVDGFELAEPGLDLAGGRELVADLGGQLGQLVLGVVQHQGAGRDQGAAVLEHGFDLGDEGVVDLQGLGGPEGGFGQQRPGRGDRVDGIGLGQAAGAPLLGAALGGDLADIQPGGDQRDRDVLAPARRALDADLADTVRGEKLDRFEVAGALVGECGGGELDAVAVHDADGERVLVRVDARDGAGHAEVSCWKVKAPVGPGRQECFGTSESGRTGSLQARSTPAGPSPGATGLTTGTRPLNVWSQRRAKEPDRTRTEQ